MARRQLAPDWKPQLPVATDMMEWQIVRGSRVPGPGNYKIKDEIADRIRGGRFGRNITKSNLELMIDRVKNDPAPHDYDVNAVYTYLHSEQKKGGVMTRGNPPKSDVDWAIYKAKQEPSPAEYKIKDELQDRIRGGRFGHAITKSPMEIHIDRVKNDPAPHDYDVNKCWESYLDRKKGGGKFFGWRCVGGVVYIYGGVGKVLGVGDE